MEKIGEKIMVNTISIVLAVIIVAIIWMIAARFKKPCACMKGKEEPTPPAQQPQAPDAPATMFYNAFGLNF